MDNLHRKVTIYESMIKLIYHGVGDFFTDQYYYEYEPFYFGIEGLRDCDWFVVEDLNEIPKIYQDYLEYGWPGPIQWTIEETRKHDPERANRDQKELNSKIFDRFDGKIKLKKDVEILYRPNMTDEELRKILEIYELYFLMRELSFGSLIEIDGKLKPHKTLDWYELIEKFNLREKFVFEFLSDEYREYVQYIHAYNS